MQAAVRWRRVIHVGGFVQPHHGQAARDRVGRPPVEASQGIGERGHRGGVQGGVLAASDGSGCPAPKLSMGTRARHVASSHVEDTPKCDEVAGRDFYVPEEARVAVPFLLQVAAGLLARVVGSSPTSRQNIRSQMVSSGRLGPGVLRSITTRG